MRPATLWRPEPVDQSMASRSGPPAWFETIRQTRRVHLEVASGSGETGPEVIFSAPLEDPGRDFRGAVISRMPLEQLRAILDEEGEVQEEKDAIDWILLDREGVILLQKSQPIGVAPSLSRASMSPLSGLRKVLRETVLWRNCGNRMEILS